MATKVLKSFWFTHPFKALWVFIAPLIPAYTVGLATRDIVLLEFSNSILCLILAGKVGSNIASEIGTMRVTEQIDALEIMGVNSANYLVLPKIIAFVGFMPVLGVLCIATAFVGGWLVAQFTDIITVSRYVYGLQALFQEWYVWYGLIKSLVGKFKQHNVSCGKSDSICRNQRRHDVELHLNRYHRSDEYGYYKNQRNGINAKLHHLVKKSFAEHFPLVR